MRGNVLRLADGDVARARLMSRLAPLGSLELLPADSTRRRVRRSDWSQMQMTPTSTFPPAERARRADKHTEVSKPYLLKKSRMAREEMWAAGFLHVAYVLFSQSDLPKAVILQRFCTTAFFLQQI